MTDWTPDSWRKKPAKQQPTYANATEVDEVVQEMAQLPPLVTSWEIETLKAQAEVEPLTALATQLWQLKKSGATTLAAYLRNMRLDLYSKADQVVMRLKNA